MHFGAPISPSHRSEGDSGDQQNLFFISFPFTSCCCFALYNIIAAIYEPLLWAAVAIQPRETVYLFILPCSRFTSSLIDCGGVSLSIHPCQSPCVGVLIHNTHIYPTILVIECCGFIKEKCQTCTGYFHWFFKLNISVSRTKQALFH